MDRKPSLLVHIRDEPSESGGAGEGGEEGVHGAEMNEVIMRVLLEQGRLQAEQLFHATALQLQQAVDDVRDNVQRHFLGLVQVCSFHLFILSHLIRPVHPPLQPPLLSHSTLPRRECLAKGTIAQV